MEFPGKIVSSADLLQEMGISRQSVWKTIELLKEEGFRIESIPHKGYCLSAVENDIAPSWIAINTEGEKNWGRNVYFFDTTDSTQKIAKGLARKHCMDGTIVVSEQQTKGRGRIDREWFSPPGKNLYMSVIFFPNLTPPMLQLVNLAAGVAVLSAIWETCGLKCSLKWPNDVICHDQKICGILSEASIESDRIHFVATGIGVNVNINAADFPQGVKAASLMNLTNIKTDRGKLASKIVSDLSHHLMALEVNGSDALLKIYKNNCSTLGRNIQIITGCQTYAGKAIGLTHRGEIIVMTEEGEMVFSAADVIHAPNK